MSRIVVVCIIGVIAVAVIACVIWFSQPEEKPVVTEAKKDSTAALSEKPGKTSEGTSPTAKKTDISEAAPKTDSEAPIESESEWDDIGPIDPNSPAAPYLEAFKLMDLENYDELMETVWKIMEEGWNEEHPEILKLLEKNREALIKLKAAIDRGDCYFPVPDDADYDFRMPHVMYCKDAGMLLALKARFFEKEGDTENAARNIADGIRFSQDVARGGLLINDLVGISVQRNFLDMIQGEIGKDRPDLHFCSAIERSLYDLEYTQAPVEKGLEVQQVMTKNSLEKLLSLDAKERAKQLPKSLFSDVTSEELKECMSLYARHHEELCSALENGLTAAIRKADELDRRIEANLKELPKLFSFLRSSFPAYLKNKARRKVEYEMARAGVALELYATEKGGYPDSLKELTPKYLPRVPVDTFSGRPMKYTSSKNGYTLYSFGYDMDDDGAKEKAESWSGEGDVVLRKERK